MESFHLPDVILSIWQVLIHLILTTTLRNRLNFLQKNMLYFPLHCYCWKMADLRGATFPRLPCRQGLWCDYILIKFSVWMGWIWNLSRFDLFKSSPWYCLRSFSISGWLTLEMNFGNGKVINILYFWMASWGMYPW